MSDIPQNPTGDDIEAAIVAAGKTGPRITPQAVEDAISTAWYFSAFDGARGSNAYRGSDPQDGQDLLYHPDGRALGLLTFCVLVLKNGFTVTGQSACADPANYDRAIGESIARKNAVTQIWPLLGFGLREELHRAAAAEQRERDRFQQSIASSALQNRQQDGLDPKLTALTGGVTIAGVYKSTKL